MIGVYGDRGVIACVVFSGCTWNGWIEVGIWIDVDSAGGECTVCDGDAGFVVGWIEGNGTGIDDNVTWMGGNECDMDRVVWNGLQHGIVGECVICECVGYVQWDWLFCNTNT